MELILDLDALSRLPENSVAVCAFDAGAASHLAVWLAPYHKKLRLHLAGPAKKIFASSFDNLPLFDRLEQSIEGAHILISGTGWSSDLEHRARLLAKAHGIPSIAVLDHWCNYPQRFQRDGIQLLPDTLWVSDSEALSIAKSTFPTVPVLELHNHWFDDLFKQVRIIRSKRAVDLSQRGHPYRKLLYLLEPIRTEWRNVSCARVEAGEFQALHFLLNQLPQMIKLGLVATPNELEPLRLRPHPSEPVGKYDEFIENVARDWPICLDTSNTLAEALGWADVAFGCETQALVAALKCGIPSFSTMPPWAPPCCLPHPSLQHLRSLDTK